MLGDDTMLTKIESGVLVGSVRGRKSSFHTWNNDTNFPSYLPHCIMQIDHERGISVPSLLSFFLVSWYPQQIISYFPSES